MIFFKFKLILFCAYYCFGQLETDYVDFLNDQKNFFINTRADTNQSSSDTLNLPANATSIRENITDNFSCENRTYGYYADVENDCQIFHVCYPVENNNRTKMYKWSFICPEDSVFNQEVLVCTYSRDSIPCEDSPQYYDKNLEFGKMDNDTNSVENDPNNKEYRKNKVRRTNNNVKERKTKAPPADNDLTQRVIDSFNVDYDSNHNFGDVNDENLETRLYDIGLRSLFGRKIT